ncbi:alcohol dehydrogenase catalytic domain-containing protein [Arthrobacter sp. MI7-26]|uniref:zinc-dependent alcohol dehydrogenase n=1 Tax=Arthrobacter sp. MI7-26 TaxID=2993653 RepID=UPI002248B01A|nr:alcohol dehydrogenase catalytic domain-containing protein [Arthrobacter sp. MI7-26]MCX2748743.1 alcohol dehydrogenase catalytic domain-containing protein [Arthrobacter sp. MI7-26]
MMSVEERDPAELRSGEVRVAVAYVGICGTDLHIFHGDMDSRVTKPATIGHEVSGTVVELGAGVEGWSVGDAVTVMPLAWDGTCPACVAGNGHICQNLDFIGIDSPGALQQFWNVPAGTLVRLPSGISLRDAALVEPVAVAVHDVRRSGLGRGDKAVVIGAGPIGVLIATVASAFGAEVVLAEIDPSRRAAAEEMGLATLDPSSVDQLAWVDDWTGGAGADVVFEVSGSAAAVLGATSLARVRGTLVVVAIHSQPRPVDLHRVFWRELTLLGARVYERRDFERAIELVADGTIPAQKLITGVVPLQEVASAFHALEAGQAMKLLVQVGDR